MLALRDQAHVTRVPTIATSPWVACALALLGAALGIAARLWVNDLLGERATFIFFVPGVVLAAALAGFWPGLFATIIGAAGALGVDAHTGDIASGNLIAAAVFLVVGIAISLGGQQFQAVQRRANAITVDLTRRGTYLRTVLNMGPDGIVVIDGTGIIRDFNTAAEHLFGWRVEEAIGQNVSILMTAPDRERHDGYLENYYRTGERRIIGAGRELVGERRDGTTFPLELLVEEMWVADERFFTGFIRDLSERHRTEARVRELQGELVHVSRLTALGEMASALAHELNQPLSAIANYLKGSAMLLAREEVPHTRVRDAISRAADEALRAGAIIRRLRDFVARGDTERRVESLPRLMEEASALALVGAREQGVRVRFGYDRAVDAVLADKVQIQQVALNLIRNALDAMAEVPVRELVVTVRPAEDFMAQVSVTDTGPGISADIAEHLFQPFRTTKPSGMGVGLSISRTIIEAHGGRIWVEAHDHAGTTFHFTLPRAREDTNHG